MFVRGFPEWGCSDVDNDTIIRWSGIWGVNKQTTTFLLLISCLNVVWRTFKGGSPVWEVFSRWQGIRWVGIWDSHSETNKRIPRIARPLTSLFSLSELGGISVNFLHHWFFANLLYASKALSSDPCAGSKKHPLNRCFAFKYERRRRRCQVKSPFLKVEK